MNIPIELIELILLNIRDTETYKNARLVCKSWHTILNKVKRFDEGYMKEYITFLPNSIITYYSNDSIKNEFYIKKDFSILFREYNERKDLINTIQFNPPYTIKQSSITMNTIMVKEYDIRKDDIEKHTLPLMNINPNCLIL